MSIVSVHGPNTFGSKAVQDAGPVQARVNPANGLIYNFGLVRPSGRPAADFDWAFPGGTPATQADSQGPIAVTYGAAGAKTATLTVSGASGLLPVNGAYPITVTAVAGTPNGLFMTGPDQQPESSGKAPSPDDGGDTGFGGMDTTQRRGAVQDAPSSSGDEGEPVDPAVAASLEASVLQSELEEQRQEAHYDPAENTVTDVLNYAHEHQDEVADILGDELAGKNRSTLVSALRDMLPYDPAEHTVRDVVEYVEAGEVDVEEVISREVANKNRTTLINKLIEIRDSTN